MLFPFRSKNEWEQPERHSNPALIQAIRRDGSVIEDEAVTGRLQPSFSLEGYTPQRDPGKRPGVRSAVALVR
jgi:hypothetical protein